MVISNHELWFSHVRTHFNPTLAASGISETTFGVPVPWAVSKAFTDACVVEIVRAGFKEVTLEIKTSFGMTYQGAAHWPTVAHITSLNLDYDPTQYMIDELTSRGIAVRAALRCGADSTFDGTNGNPDYRNPANTDFIDWSLQVVRELMANTAAEVMIRYPMLKGIDLDYIRTGINTAVQAEIDANTTNVTDVVTRIHAARDLHAPHMKIRAWGIYNPDFISQGNNRRVWADAGLIDEMLEPVYRLPNDSDGWGNTFNPESIANLYGDNPSGVIPGIIDPSKVVMMPSLYAPNVDGEVVLQTLDQMHWVCMHAIGYTQNPNISLINFAQVEENLLEYIRDVIFNEAPETVYTKDLTNPAAVTYGVVPEEVYAPGEFVYRRWTDIAVIGSDGLPTSTIAGVNDPAYAKQNVSHNGAWIGEGVRSWMVGSLTNPTDDGIELIFTCTYDKADDKGGNIVLAGFQIDLEEYLTIYQHRYTGEITVARRLKGGPLETISSTLDYVDGDRLEVSLKYNHAGTTLICKNLTTVTETTNTLPGPVEFNGQSIWMIGAATGQSVNPSPFYLENIVQGTEQSIPEMVDVETMLEQDALDALDALGIAYNITYAYCDPSFSIIDNSGSIYIDSDDGFIDEEDGYIDED